MSTTSSAAATLDGLAEIDRQHEALKACAEELVRAIRRGNSRDEVAHTLAFLRTYATTHLGEEDALMCAAGYPDRDAHRREHAALVRELAAFEAEHARDGATPGLVLRVSSRVRAWLRDHTAGPDRDLAEYLRACPPG